jgi:hypothetical protein
MDMAKFGQQMIKVFERYAEEVDPSPTDLGPVAEWAIANGLYRPIPRDIVRLCKEDLAESLRQHKRVDPQGRKYRAKRSVRTNIGGVQLNLWADADTAPRSFMEKSFAQGRKSVANDMFQLKMDHDHYNDDHPEEPPITLVLDFTEDMAEMEVAARSGRDPGEDSDAA